MGEDVKRPIYETKADVANEEAVARLITEARGYMMVKLPRLNQMDYAAFTTDGLKALIEIKCRRNTMAKYDSMMIGMEKVLHARQVYKHFGVKSYLFVQWTDQLGYVCLEDDCTIDMGGRTDRNDPNDMSLHAYFDIDKFRGL